MRALLVLPVLLLAFALLTPGAALAAGEPTSGYTSKPEEPKPGTTPSGPKEEPKTGTSPSGEKTGTSPSGEKTSPSGEESPEKAAEPSKQGEPAAAKGEKAGKLPFTGFDLRWSLVAGLLLMGAGFSIVVVQRRQHRSQR